MLTNSKFYDIMTNGFIYKNTLQISKIEVIKMKRIIALILVVLMCFSIVACGKNKNNEENAQGVEEPSIKSQLVGDWYDVGANKGKISFNENGTGNMDYDGSKTDFTWSYDTAKESFYVRISGKSFYINLAEKDGVAYVDMSGNWFFRESDMTSGKEAVLKERRADIAKDLEGKNMLSAGAEININETFSVKVDSITKANNKMTLEMTLKNNSGIPVSIEDLGERIYIGKTKFYLDKAFSKIELDKLGTAPIVENNAIELNAGAEIKLSFDLLDMEGFNGVIEHWGEVNAYRSIMFGESEYYVDLSK